MAERSKEYRRLPGRGRSFLGYFNIHLGPDHLLTVNTRFWAEEYKRFYFQDVQAIIARKTIAGKLQNILLLLAASLFLYWTWKIRWMPEASYTVLALAGISVSALLVNWLRGPTCICQIQTAVQTEKLPSLNRVKSLEKFMAIIRPRIEAAQGRAAPEIMAQADFIPTAVPSRPVKTRPRHIEPGRIHGVLFLLLILDGLFGLLTLFYRLPSVILAGVVLIMILNVLVIVALLKQHGSNLPGRIQTLTWAALAYSGLNWIFSTIFTIVLTVKFPEVANNYRLLLDRAAALDWLSQPWLLGPALIFVVSSLGLGGAGLIYLAAHRNQSLSRIQSDPLHQAGR